MQRLDVDIKPSRRVSLLLCVLLVLAFSALMLSGLLLWQKILAAIVLFLYAVFLLKKYGYRSHLSMPVSLSITSRQNVILNFRGGEQKKAAISGFSVLTPYVCFISFCDQDSAGSWNEMYFPDHFQNGMYRRLYLRIKWCF